MGWFKENNEALGFKVVRLDPSNPDDEGEMAVCPRCEHPLFDTFDSGDDLPGVCHVCRKCGWESGTDVYGELRDEYDDDDDDFYLDDCGEPG